MRQSRKGHKKLYNESFRIPKARGNGILKREVWVNSNGEVTRYSLAYINHQLCQVDNGRVIGYDNSHGHHHRHYFGQEEAIEFTGYADIEQRFEKEWRALHGQGDNRSGGC